MSYSKKEIKDQNNKLKEEDLDNENPDNDLIDDDGDDENATDDDIIDDDNCDDEDDGDDDGDDGGDDEDGDDDAVYFKFNTSSHKLEGKHRLKRDTIFNGKLEDQEDQEYYMYSSNSEYYNKDFPIEKGTTFEMESRNSEDLENSRQLKKDIFNILNRDTSLDFSSNRRKPNRQAFNSYFELLVSELDNDYSRSEIFVELSYYFTDHIFNMYKLLYPEHATSIIMEMRDKGYLKELDDMKFV